MFSVLAGLQVIISIILIPLILMHSGKDAGLSGAFGVGAAAASSAAARWSSAT